MSVLKTNEAEKPAHTQHSQKRHVEIMDTTLRDGEQMQNISYMPHEKLSVAKLLLKEVKVDRIEITSARVSKGEEKSVSLITEWAIKENLLDRVEILGFVDATKSVDWITSVNGKVMNLLTKGSRNHLENQLHQTQEEHVKRIMDTVDYAMSKGVTINVYLEDWSNGMLHSRDYVFFLIQSLIDSGKIKRVMLPDTLGVLMPDQVREFITLLKGKFPKGHFDFHPHNDYGLGTANCLTAVQYGADGVHLTVNGMGERAGNAPLEEVVACIKDFTDVTIGVDESKLYLISKTIELYSGQRVSFNKPILGENVFTQTAGIHADGDKKGKLYSNKLVPERFSRQRVYALGKLSGKSNLDFNLERLGIQLDAEEKTKVLKKIIELGDQKEEITEEDLPYIISDVLESPEERTFKINSCAIVSSIGLKPIASISVSYNGKTYSQSSEGDGGFDAFVRSIKKIFSELSIELPRLTDYEVTIPPGGKTDALVYTRITWESPEKGMLKTKGVNSDQLMAAVEATEKMINYYLSDKFKR